MKATMINKSDIEDDESPKKLFAEKLLVPKIEPAMFVSSYRITVFVIAYLKAYNSTDEIRFDLRGESSNTKNQCDRLSLFFFRSLYLMFINRESDSQDDSMASADDHSEHSIQLRKAKKAKKIQNDMAVYVLSYYHWV